MTLKYLTLFGATLLITSSFLTSCMDTNAQGTSSGNPLVQIHFSSYSTGASEKISTSDNAPLSLDEIVLCFKRLRFKVTTADTDPDTENNINLDLGEVTLDPAGTNLGTVALAAGSYRRVEFDLWDKCGSGSSVQVRNSNGAFETNDHITIRFDGNFTYTGGTADLDLLVQNLLDALKGVSDSSSIKGALQGVSGAF
jgi:hypothetical protein